MLKIRTYFLIALFVYIAVLLSALPASWLVAQVQKQVGDDFTVQNTSGTVWQGSVQGALNEQSFALDWRLRPWYVFLLKLSSGVIVKTELGDFKLNLALGYKSIDIDGLSGLINRSALNSLLKENGAGIEILNNDIAIQDIVLSRAGAQFEEADGKIRWDGGAVAVPNLPAKRVDLPPLDVVLSFDDKGVALSVITLSDSDNSSLNLLEMHLSHDGNAHIQLKEQVADFVPVPAIFKKDDPESVIFEIKREVFNTGGKF